MADALSIGVTGLRAFQNALNAVSHNIANVNTEGYSRQTVPFATGTPTLVNGQWGGSGVKSGAAVRQYESFVANQITVGNTTVEELDVFNTFASRLDDIYADPETGAAPVIQNFFDSLQALAADSGSAAARQLVLSDGASLADRFGQLNDRTEEIRDQVNDALQVAVNDLQSFAQGLADINDAIITATAQGGGVTPPDLLDQRDQIVNEIAKLTSVKTVEQDNGALNLFVGNGVALVIGSQVAEIGTQPAKDDPGALDIVVKQTASASPQIVTPFITGGKIGGLERFRNEILDPAQDQLGLTALGIAEQINAQHRLGMDLNGVLGGDFFQPMSGEALANSANNGNGAVTLTLDDSSHLTGDEYRLSYNGANYQLTRLSDNSLLYTGALPATEAALGGQGFSLNLAAGVPVAGDSFLIRPTRNGARDIELALHDTDSIAAAGPLITDPNGDPSNAGNGRISQPQLVSTTGNPLSGWVSPGDDITLTYTAGGFNAVGGGFTGVNPVTPDAEGVFTLSTELGNLSFSLQGTPIVGDTFEIRLNLDAAGNAPVADNRNAVLMAEMHNQKIMLGGKASFEGTFSKMVAMVGTETRQAEIAYTAQSGLLLQAQAAQAEVSGVNLDEEAANLLRYQQAYQAAAQVVTIAQNTFDALLAAVRG